MVDTGEDIDFGKPDHYSYVNLRPLWRLGFRLDVHLDETQTIAGQLARFGYATCTST